MSLRPLTPDLVSLAARELNENDDQLKEAIRYIDEWLSKTPHIVARTEPQWLASFLRGCKYSLERTKEKLDAYYTIRTHLPEIFTNRDPKKGKIKEILSSGTYLPLPLTASSSSPRVILVRGAIWDPKKYTFLDVLVVFFMIMDVLLLEDDRLNVAGQDIVLDLTGSRLEHASQFTPSVIKKAVTCFQNAYPMKTKSLHFINAPPTFDAIFVIFKTFMSEKLRRRIMVHNNPNDLYKYIPKSVLPSDYGGEGPSIEAMTKDWKNKVTDRREWFLEDEKYRVNESMRPGKPISGMDLFGVDGSFKQLSFD
ncbi:retinol-binding protein pinta-like isoform X2 [Venturia canescens]|nr:retinol-binding protein pinta-like isoform X2 [Venturia canescens]XP_043272932.1 retinol-binding protein pinta-like isoform X2 [Venturia canescens]